jgi:hypothetical protein
MTATMQREILLPDGSIRMRSVKHETDSERRRREDGLRDVVVQRIAEYERAIQEMDTARRHLASMQTEENQLLERPTVTDDEIRVANSRTIVARNAFAKMEEAHSKSWSALESAHADCHQICKDLQIDLMARERARIERAVVAAAEWPPDDHDDKRRESVMWGVWALSTPIQVIGLLAISAFRVGGFPNGDIRLLHVARELVEKWQRLREWEAKS